jgi:hypothetical protein
VRGGRGSFCWLLLLLAWGVEVLLSVLRLRLRASLLLLLLLVVVVDTRTWLAGLLLLLAAGAGVASAAATTGSEGCLPHLGTAAKGSCTPWLPVGKPGTDGRADMPLWVYPHPACCGTACLLPQSLLPAGPCRSPAHTWLGCLVPLQLLYILLPPKQRLLWPP